MTSLSDDLAARWTPSKEQDAAAAAAMTGGVDHVYTAHLLLGKRHGWWGPDIVVEPLPGVFADRDEASRAIVSAGEKRHRETGQPLTGGYTSHSLARQGDPAPPTSADGTQWSTHWAVFEDILCTFPKGG